ncbi:MAG TPA: Lrp/AsnC family transcriptional regulator [Methanosarcinaceae archaeon]|nr:Lrp/AsnC family transcriptional regulator [Methanosarcinaceae archaeon]
MDKQVQHILEILEDNAKVTPKEIANLTGMTIDNVTKSIEQFEKSGIIRKYKTIIDWELAGEEFVHAIIELKVTLERKLGYQAIAECLYKFPQVRSVRLLSGGHDLSLTIRGRSMKEVAFFVAGKIATLDQVQGTTTHFVLKTYKEDGVILYETEHIKRLQISP